jgi:hypothetical protein
LSSFDITFIAAVVVAFCTFGVVLVWGTYRTKDLHKR